MSDTPPTSAATETERIKVAVRGDMHHLIQPVIGFMRLYSEGDHEAPTREQVAGWVDRLRIALQVADAIGDDHARNMLAGQMGLGFPATPESEARNQATLRAILEGSRDV